MISCSTHTWNEAVQLLTKAKLQSVPYEENKLWEVDILTCPVSNFENSLNGLENMAQNTIFQECIIGFWTRTERATSQFSGILEA